MKAYLEKIGGEWLDDFVYMSVEPLKQMGFTIIPFDGDDMENTLTNRVLNLSDDIVIGSVQASTEFFKACGVKTPKYLGYPMELSEYLGREIIETTFEHVVSKGKFPIFIKPSEGVKLFTGCVIENNLGFDFLRDYYNVEDDTPLYCSEILEFVSEHRCFVHEGELKGIQHYTGDFKLFPDVSVIENMIKDYESANCAYTLDVGITKEGKTCLVEVNDMWAIGSYGFNSKTYVLMCVRRMREIHRQHNGEKTPLWKRLKK